MIEPYYDDGQITVYVADCRDALPQLERCDLLLTDPPYGINFAGQPTKWQRLAGAQPADWDNEPFGDLEALLECAPVQCIWGGNYYPLPPSRGWMVWVKPDAPPSMGSAEMAWTNLDQNARYIEHSISATNAERIGHPNQKPLRVIKWCLSGLPEGSILDPFAGSLTTAVAAKHLGRRCIAIEREEKYVIAGLERLRQGVLL